MKAAPMANAMKKPKPTPANTFTKLQMEMEIKERWVSNLEAQLAEEPTFPRGIVSVILPVVDGRGKGASFVVDDLLDETEENRDDYSGFECLSEYEEEYGD